MTIRLRLTLTYSTILALTLIVFGFALYTFQAQETLNALESDLVMSSNKFVDALISIQFPFGSRPTQQEPPAPRPFNQFTDEQAFRDVREREIVRVLDSDGNLIASPFGLTEDALPLSNKALAQLQQNESVFETGTANDETMLIYNHPITNNSGLIYIIQVARSLTERNRTLNSLATTLSFAGLVTILIAFGVGWWLSGLALRPIDRITQTARTIGEQRDFTRRVEHTGKQDEVSLLANTFNRMLTQLQDAYLKVEHSLEQQRNFVSDVSHELRTPLTTIRGNLGLLLHEPPIPPDEEQDILGDMVDENERLIRLVNELLMLAHADSGRSMTAESLMIQPLIEEVTRQVKHLDPNRRIILDISPDLDVIADRDAFKQVILILLDNAIKYSQDEIVLSARRRENQVTLEIADHGQGIPSEELPHVFERFYRTEETETLPGFGLGLPIAKSLMDGMGGKISIQSHVGKGSCVTITFFSPL